MALDAMSQLDAPANEEVVKQGSDGNHFYVVENGTLEVIVDGKKVGQELGPGTDPEALANWR